MSNPFMHFHSYIGAQNAGCESNGIYNAKYAAAMRMRTLVMKATTKEY